MATRIKRNIVISREEEVTRFSDLLFNARVYKKETPIALMATNKKTKGSLSTPMIEMNWALTTGFITDRVNINRKMLSCMSITL